MVRELQNISFIIYPEGEEPRPWQLQAYIYGVWAVHRHHPDESPEKYWCISHAATGCRAFSCRHLDVAIHAALLLAELEPPAVIISTKDEGVPAVAPLPIEWIEESVKQVKDMPLWVDNGGEFISVDEAIELIRRIRAKQAEA